MARWLIDAGHGGSDTGAMYKGRRESNDVLRMACEIGNILLQNGENVNYTRLKDSRRSLEERSNMENNGTYDYFISIHRNAYEPEKAKGVETHIYSRNGKAEELADKVNEAIAATGFVNRGVKVSNFHVLRETRCAAILVEIGFIDNSNDNSIFDSNFYKIANAAAKACLKQVGKTIKETTTSASTGQTNVVWRVITGSYKDKNNAIAQQENLAQAGFNSFLEAHKIN